MSDPQTPFEEPSAEGPADPVAPTTDPERASAEPVTVWGPMPPEPPQPRRRGPVFVVGAISLVIVLAAGMFVLRATRPKESANARTIALSFTQGQSESYAISMSMNGTIDAGAMSQPIDMVMDETQSWTVTDVAPDGVATVRVDVSDVSGTMNGTSVPADLTTVPPITMRIAPDGRVLTVGGLTFPAQSSASGYGFPGMGQFAPLLPDGKVARGDSWDKSFSQEFPFGSGKIEFNAHSTFESYEDLQGTRAAVIRTQFDVPLDFTVNVSDMLSALGGSNTSTGPSGLAGLEDASIEYGGQGSFTQKAWVDLDTKRMLKSESTGSFDMTMSFSGVPDLNVGRMHFTGDFTQTLEKV